MPPHSHSPLFRNAVHAGAFFLVGLPMIFLARSKWLPQFDIWAAAFMLLVTLANMFILPRLRWGRIMRRVDEGTDRGILLYPFVLALCFLILPTYAACAAWAVMASGDAAAALFGRTFPIARLPWNKAKSVAGLLGFVACAGVAAYLSLWLLPCPLFLKANGSPELPYVWTLAILAATTGAIVESIDSRIDDNIRVPFAAAGAIMLAVYFLNYSTHSLPAKTHVQPEQLIHALIANAILGALVLLFGFASLPGTLLGMALGTVIYFYAHWQGYLLFGLFVCIGSALSKVGLKRKKENQTAEANEGKRGIGNVVANLLVPALCCALYPLSAGRASLLMAFAGSIAAALADTASSEIGVLSPNKPYLLTTLKPVPHGTNGAISVLGTCGAFAASALIAITAWLTGFFQVASGPQTPLPYYIQNAAVLLLFAAGMLGTFADSFLGATVEDKFPGIGKGAVNFACTLTGAIVAGGCTEIWIMSAR